MYDDKLLDNVLYVPAGEFDITGGKCSTADVNTARASNKGLSMEGNYPAFWVDFLLMKKGKQMF
jgi:hypothetical protein